MESLLARAPRLRVLARERGWERGARQRREQRRASERAPRGGGIATPRTRHGGERHCGRLSNNAWVRGTRTCSTMCFRRGFARVQVVLSWPCIYPQLSRGKKCETKTSQPLSQFDTMLRWIRVGHDFPGNVQTRDAAGEAEGSREVRRVVVPRHNTRRARLDARSSSYTRGHSWTRAFAFRAVASSSESRRRHRPLEIRFREFPRLELFASLGRDEHQRHGGDCQRPGRRESRRRGQRGV
jgi:hypothetical protein